MKAPATSPLLPLRYPPVLSSDGTIATDAKRRRAYGRYYTDCGRFVVQRHKWLIGAEYYWTVDANALGPVTGCQSPEQVSAWSAWLAAHDGTPSGSREHALGQLHQALADQGLLFAPIPA